MAVGRLKKETNPLPGYEPGFLPQHERADGEFQTTGENHPLPTANYVQNESGVWVTVSKQNPMPVQLTGSFVNHLDSYIVPASTIKYIGKTDSDGFRGMTVYIRCSQKYTLTFYPHTGVSGSQTVFTIVEDENATSPNLIRAHKVPDECFPTFMMDVGIRNLGDEDASVDLWTYGL